MTLHAKIHVGCKQLGIGEDDRRALYRRVTGKDSLTKMSVKEHQAVVEELKSKGFKAVSNHLQGRFAKKLQALWIACWNLGLTRDKSDRALLAFVKRQTGIDHTRFLTSANDADKVIEALKGWMVRDAHVCWQTENVMPPWSKQPGYRIAAAQYRILLSRKKSCGSGSEFGEYCRQLVQKPLHDLKADDWQVVMNALGRQIRAAK